MLISAWLAKLFCPSSGSVNLITQVKEPLPDKWGFQKICISAQQPDQCDRSSCWAWSHPRHTVPLIGRQLCTVWMSFNWMAIISPCPWVCFVYIKCCVLSIKSITKHIKLVLQSIYNTENVSLLLERADAAANICKIITRFWIQGI